MYHMKSIIDHGEGITLPKCMYHVRNPNETLKDEMNLDIHNQVMKFLKLTRCKEKKTGVRGDSVTEMVCSYLDPEPCINTMFYLFPKKAPNNKMSELERRQEVLIKKLDILYDRIKTISSYCNQHGTDEGNDKTTSISAPEEVVLVADPDYLPWYLNKVLKEPSAAVNLSWHIHSSVPNEKVATIKSFGKGLKTSANESVKINLRLILKNVSTDSELKLSSLAMPIIGTVNILRYLSYAYPKAIPYDDNDYQMDALLDMCHIIEKSSERNKENYVKLIFSKCKDWIYQNKYSVVDLAMYNVIKQSKNCMKLIPKEWFAKCERMCA